MASLYDPTGATRFQSPRATKIQPGVQFAPGYGPSGYPATYVGAFPTPPSGTSPAPNWGVSAQGDILGAAEIQPSGTQQPTTSSGGGTVGGYGPTAVGGLADDQIASQQAREQAELAALETARGTAVSGVETGYEAEMGQYGLQKKFLGEEVGLQKQQWQAAQDRLAEQGMVSLGRIHADLEKYRGQSTREAEVARVRARKMAGEATRQARVTARALGASASSDFMAILSEVENWSLGQQGEIDTSLLQTMDEYNLQATRATQDYEIFTSTEQAKVNEAIQSLDMWKNQQIKQISYDETTSLQEKNQSIKEINTASQQQVESIMTMFNDKIAGIEQWRTETEISMQQAAASRASSLQQEEFRVEEAVEAYRAEGLDDAAIANILASRMPGGEQAVTDYLQGIMSPKKKMEERYKRVFGEEPSKFEKIETKPYGETFMGRMQDYYSSPGARTASPIGYGIEKYGQSRR